MNKYISSHFLSKIVFVAIWSIITMSFNSYTMDIRHQVNNPKKDLGLNKDAQTTHTLRTKPEPPLSTVAMLQKQRANIYSDFEDNQDLIHYFEQEIAKAKRLEEPEQPDAHS